jgi:hypothetical protein
MRPVLTERISVPSSEAPTVPALPWSTGSQRFWVWKLPSCFNAHQRWSEARGNYWLDWSTKVGEPPQLATVGVGPQPTPSTPSSFKGDPHPSLCQKIVEVSFVRLGICTVRAVHT